MEKKKKNPLREVRNWKKKKKKEKVMVMGEGRIADAMILLWAPCCCRCVDSLFMVAEAGLETAPAYPSHKKHGNCNYTIIIETTCTKGAGTSDHASLRFGDSRSNDVLVHPLKTRRVRSVDATGPAVLDDVPRKPFRECAADVFQVSGDCVRSQVCYLFLKHRGEDRWRPGRAQAVVAGEPRLSSGSFYFRRFLPRRVWHGFDTCGSWVTPFGVGQTRKVFAMRHGSKSP